VGLLAPTGLALLGLAVPLVALYLLKQRRVDRVVPSTLLWRKVLSDIEARRPFQRLRANLLLLLQLLLIALLAVAVARPVIRSEAREARTLAIVLDGSASMTAVSPGGATRFEEARAQALTLLSDMSLGDRAMVVLAGRAARTLKALSQDRDELAKAVRAARPEETRGEVRDAVLLAAAALRPMGAAAEVHLFGDGGGGDLPTAGEAAVALKFHAVGAPGENAGVTGLDIVRGKDGRVEVFATVENAGSRPAVRYATLLSGERAVASRALTLAPGAEEAVVFRERLPPGRVTVRLEPGPDAAAGAAPDALACDDAAFAVLPPEEPLAVAVVGRSHAALERALRMAGLVEVFRAGPDAASYKDDARFRLVIYDGYEGGPLPERPVLVFGPRADLPGVKVLPPVEGPEVTGVEREHPLLRFVELSGIAIAEARPLTLDGPGRALVRTDRGVVALESRARRDPLVVVGMDLRESSFAAEEAFPVFLLNVIHMARRQGGALAPEQIRTGEPLSVRVSGGGGTGEAELTLPSGERVARRARGGRADFLETGRAGFYEVTADGKSAVTAASLLERAETRIAPRAPRDAAGAPVAAEAQLLPANREVWPWLAAAALVLLVLEAWVFHRRL